MSKKNEGEKLTTEKYEKVIQELKESQYELKSILEELPDVFYRTDMNGIITMMNSACKESIGYTPEEMIGAPMAQFYKTPTERAKVAQAIVDGGGKAKQVEAAMRHKSGKVIWVSTNANVRVDKDGNPTHVEGIARNITERKAMEDLLARQNATQNKLLQVLSHDLTNPLSNILTIVNMMKREESISSWLPHIRNAASSGLDIIDMVRESHTLNEESIALEIIEMDSVIRNLKEMMQFKLDNKELGFEVNVEPDIHVLAEKTSLTHSVLGNLISNSIKFSSRGDLIRLDVKEKNNQIEIVLQDQGIGIPEKMLTKLFDIGTKTSRPGTEQEKGTGYGMLLVKFFVGAYGGSVEVNSKAIQQYESGHGTEVTINLLAK